MAELKRLVDNPSVHKVIGFTWSFPREQVDRAFELGGHGFLSKTASADQIVDVVERTVAGGRIVVPAQAGHSTIPSSTGLANGRSCRQGQLSSSLITQARSNTRSQLLHLSVHTIKSTIRTIGVRNRVQAVLWGTANNIGPAVGDYERRTSCRRPPFAP